MELRICRFSPDGDALLLVLWSVSLCGTVFTPVLVCFMCMFCCFVFSSLQVAMGLLKA